MPCRKEFIARSFDNYVGSYDQYAVIQRQTAVKLLNLVTDSPENILEIGCGTGFLTKYLIKKYPNAKLTAIDISQAMINASMPKFPHVIFKKADGETFIPDQKFDLIISNMTVQWFNDPLKGTKNLTKFLNQNGKLFFSTLGKNSFWQWKETVDTLNFSSTLLPVPAYHGIIKEEEEIIDYKNGYNFLSSLKKIGAGHSNKRPLSPLQLKQACEYYNKKYSGAITWHILYGCLMRPS